MAATRNDNDYPTISNKTVQKFAGKTIAKMNIANLTKWLENRVRAGGLSRMQDASLAELQELSLLGSDNKLPIEEAIGLFRGEAIRGVNKPNVDNVAKLLVSKGYNPNYPITIGVLPISGGNNKEVRVCVLSGLFYCSTRTNCGYLPYRWARRSSSWYHCASALVQLL